MNKKNIPKFGAISASLKQPVVNWKDVLSTIISSFGCSTGTIHFLEAETTLLKLETQIGIPDFLIPKLSEIPIGKGMAGIAAERREPVEMCNLQTDNSGVARPSAKETKVEGSIVVPMMLNDQLYWFFLMLQISFVTAQTSQDTLGMKQEASVHIESQQHLEGIQSGKEDDSFLRELDTIITSYNYNNPIEKVYLHTDRDLISSSENLWYKVYTVLGEYHQFSLASKVIHVELIDPSNKILVSQTHELFDGKANGFIRLPQNLSSGNYQLRAYTNWMRNFNDNFFFKKMIKVVGETDMPAPSQHISDKIDLQFFPEGGHAVAGLIGQKKKPWCERVVFINNQRDLVINARISPEKIAKRNEIAVDIKVTDANGEPVSTELSMAITDTGQVVKNSNSGNILTHLLLQSDIKGHIENPGLLFKDQNRLTLYALDLVMLTHGWRKFPWQEIQEKPLLKKKFNFVKGLTISGQARSGIDKLLKNKDLNIITKSGDIVGMFSARTDRDGKFSIPNFNFIGTTRVIFNAMSSSKTAMNVKVAIDDNKISVPPSHFKSPLIISDSVEATAFADYSSTRKNMHLIYDSQNVTELEEVVVTEKVTKIEPAAPSALGQTADATLHTKDTHETSLNLVDYVGRFASVTVSGSMPNYQVSIRRGGAPLWVLNGIPVATDLSQARPSVPGQIATMDISNVERVEVLHGVSAVMWGARGANGVILVYTKRGGGASCMSLSLHKSSAKVKIKDELFTECAFSKEITIWLGFSSFIKSSNKG
ncbi:hypothetical protein GQR58_030278 [Nymphon striatum]|nr:hypothetical protein GQR58_030278 [Nymphon striatum]